MTHSQLESEKEQISLLEDMIKDLIKDANDAILLLTKPIISKGSLLVKLQ